MWSLTWRRAERIRGPEKFRSSVKKDFFNTIDPKRTSAERVETSVFGPRAEDFPARQNVNRLVLRIAHPQQKVICSAACTIAADGLSAGPTHRPLLSPQCLRLFRGWPELASAGFHNHHCRMMRVRDRCAYPPLAIASYGLLAPKTGAAPAGSTRPILPAGVNSQSFNTSLLGYCD